MPAPTPRRPRRSLVHGLVLVAVTAAGCGSPPPPAADVAAPPAPTTTAPAAATTPARATRVAAPPPAGRLKPAPSRPPASSRPAGPTTPPAGPAPAGPASAQVGEPKLYGFGCDRTEAEVAASGAPRVRRGTTTIYAGAQQVGGANQDPRIVRFDGGRRTWCREDYERSGDDGRAYGLVWSGDVLLAVFSAVGTQGDASGDLRRFTAAGWLSSYSAASPLGGGGPKVAAVVRLDPATGAGVPGSGTWLTALNNGKVNGASVTALAVTGAGIRVTLESGFLPRRADRSALTCTGSSPFAVTYTFDRSLRSVLAVDAPSCR